MTESKTTPISRLVIAFLCGEKSLNGVWFHEENERQINRKPPRRYWWRSYLRSEEKKCRKKKNSNHARKPPQEVWSHRR